MTQKNGKALKGICHASHIVPEIASNFVTQLEMKICSPQDA
jgi:hypothetical protein